MHEGATSTSFPFFFVSPALQACIDTVRSKDPDPFLPLLLHTMVHVEETAETIYCLGTQMLNNATAFL
jgi:hypothetical protein